MAILGTVVALNGEASVIDEKGIKKPLHLGDVVQPGDTIITPRGVVVELEMVNGRKIQVVSEQTVKFTQELADAIPPDSGDSSVDQATVQAVIKAIAEGKDLSEVLEETAAGLGAGGGNSYGFSFVDLLRITEGVTPIGFEYDRSGRNDINIEPLPQPINGLTTTTPGATNNAPVAQDIAIGNTEGSPAVNGNLPASDVDGDTLTYTAIGALPPGLTLNPDGSFTFNYSDPAYDVLQAGGTQIISVPFTVNDGKGGTDTATLTITITGTNDDPVATATVVTGEEDAPFIPVTLTGTDVDGTVNFVTVTTLPLSSQGTLYLADGTTPVVAGVLLTPAQATGLHFVPAPDFNGNVTIPFTVTDNLGAVSTPSTATITVNPVVDPVISINDITVDEAAGTATFTVTLDQPTTATVGVSFNTSNGSATAGADYTGATGTLTFLPGQTTQTIVIQINNDGTYEGPETFNVNLTAPVNASIGDNLGVATIVDDGSVPGGDDDRPAVGLVSSPSVVEGGNLDFTVTLTHDSTTPTTVTLTPASGTADLGTDTDPLLVSFDGGATFVPVVGNVVNVPANSSSFIVRVPTVADTTDEPDETITLGASTPTNTTPVVGTGTILDNDGAPQISITGPATVNEAAGTITYTISLSNPSASTVTVNYASADGGATAGSDYTAASGSLSFAPGETTKTITVAITDDTVFEGAEDYSINLSAPTNATIGTGSVTTSITDNDLPPTITSVEPGAAGVGDDAVPEGTSLVYNVTLSNPSSSPVTYNFTLGGGLSTAGAGDIGSPVFSAGVTDNGNGTITVAPGVTGFSVTVPTTQDTIDEFDETVELTVGGVTGTGTITDDDAAPTISITGPATIDEAAGTATYTVTLSNASGKPVTVDYGTSNGLATAGSDYVATSGTLTFNPGTTTLTFTVPISEDLITEASEDFTVSLVAPTNATIATGSVTTNIIDNEGIPTITNIVGDAQTEGTALTYNVTLSNPSATPVTYAFTVGAGSSTASATDIGTPVFGAGVTDNGDGTITVAPGVTGFTVTVPSTQDLVAESNETVELTIGTATGTGTIIDNDGAPQISITGPGSVNEAAGTITYTVSLTNPSASTVTVNYASANGSATAGSDYTGVTGTLSFAPGETTKTITVAITDDTVFEGAEDYSINLSAPTNATIGAGSVTTTINDDGTGNPNGNPPTDDRPQVASVSSPSIAEGGNLDFVVTLSNASTTPTTVNLTPASGTATLGSDTTTPIEVSFDGGANFTTLVGGSVSVPAGTTSLIVRVPTINDVIAEGNEFITLAASTAQNIAPVTGTGTITDTIDVTTVSLSATPSVVEGGSIVYTATLTNAAASPVTVNLVGGQVITIATGATTGTVSVAAPSDDVYLDAGSVSKTISSATGGGFESLAVNPAPANTTVTDTIDVTTVSIAGSASVTEGGTASYTLSLNNPAQTDVTVNLTYSGTAANGADYTGVATVTILAGQSTANFNLTTIDDALAEGAENITVTIGSATGGNFESLVVSGTNGAVTTNLIDNDVASISLSATPSLTEAGGTIVYTATVTQAPTTALTVTLDNGAIITIAAGQLTGSANLPVSPSDDVYIDPTSISAIISTTSGGGIPFTIDTTPAITSITDTIDTTTVSLSATPSVTEGGSIVYTATLTSAAGSPVTVNLSGGQVITIAAGATTGTVSVAAPADDVYLDAGTVSKTITGATGGNFENLVVNTTPAATNVTDTLDVTTVSIAGSSSITEGATGSYTVSLNNPAQTNVTVNLSYSGTAANGSDYTGVATVTILAGQSSANFNLVSTDDNIAEGTENFTVTIGSVTGGNFESLVVSGTNGSVTTSITDNDLPPTITSVEPGAAGVGDDAVPEGTSLVYNVTLSNPSSSPVTYNFTLGGGLSTAGAGDIGSPVFSAGVTDNGNGTITVAPGVTGFSVTVPTTQDTIDEFDETVELTVGGVTGTGTITDDDAAPTISITGPATIDEAAGTATYTVTLSNASGKPVTVDYGTSNGLATAGSDYVATSGTLTFNPGTTTLTFTVPISEDLITEASEDFTVSLVAPTNATIATGSVTTNIIDNEGIPTITNIVGDAQTEGTALTYNVTLSNPSATPVTYAFTVGAGSSTASATDIGTPVFGAGVTDNGDGTITVAPGVTGFTVTVPSTQDLVAESNETVELTIGTATGTGTIIDNDGAPQISITGPGSVNEAAGTITYTVSLTNPSASTVTVNYASANGSATAGSDYTGVTGTLSFAPGETTKTITVAITDDTVFEGAEDYSINLSAPTNATIGAGSVTTTITDNDTAPTIASVGAATVAEGGNLVHTVTLSNASSTSSSFAYSLTGTTATAGSDFSTAASFSNGVTLVGGTLIVPANVTSFTVTYATLDDALNEATETTALNVGGVIGVGSITDNDATPSISINDVTVNEAAGTATFTVTLSAASGQTVTVGYNTSNGTATAGSDYTSAAGTLTFTPGTTTQTITVPITNDTIYEGAVGETFNVNLLTPTNATIADNLGVGTITDNDTAPTIASVGAATVAEGGNLVHTVTLSNASSTSSSFAYSLTGTTATAGSDFSTAASFSNGVTLVGGNLIVPANVTSFTVTYATLDDALNEATETTALNVGGVIGVGSITDNDATPSISINDVTVNEAAGTATFTVTLSAASGQTVTVGYNTSNGTATAGSDYTSAAGTLTFTPGTTTQTITVPITNDTIYEGAVGETFNVNLLTPTNATIADNLGVGTITDNDTAPTIASVGAATVAEGGNLVHTVTLSNASSTSSSFAYSLTGTTATAGSDFSTAASFSNGVTLVGGNLIVPANVTSFTVTYATLDDALNEATETTALNVGGVIGVGSITDNDATPSISINDVTVNEAAGTATFTVTLSAASGQTVTVGYNTSNGTATAGSDYTSAAGTLTFTPGTTTQTITVPITNDTIYEGAVGETFNVNLLTPTNATIADNLGVGTITDNDTAPTIASVGAATVAEGGNLVHTVTLSNASSTSSSFAYSLTGTTATAGSDFSTAASFSNGVTLVGGNLIVPANVTSFTVTYATLDDALNEATETTALNVGGVIGVGSITDNDATPSISINDVTVNEAAGTATFTVTLSAASGQTVTVGYNTSNGTATAGSDYTSAAGTLTFTPGTTTQTITVPITNDTIYEGAVGETFNVNLLTPTNATIADNLGVGTITDNDTAPTIASVGAATVAEGGNLVHTVTLSNASSTSSSFAYSLTGTTATAGSDFSTAASFSNGVTLVGGNLIVPANVTSFTVTYATLDDALNEATETTALNVGGVIGVGSITDNDATPSISINDVTVNEAAGTATFTVTLSAASGQTVTVGYNTSNGTATAGSDYTSAAGTLTFTPGTTTQTITVPITNDTIYEGAVGETFNVNLLTPTNATIADNLGVGTITDNDTAPTIASVGAATVAEGGNLVHTVTLSNASSTSSSFAYSLTGTTATAGSDFSTAASFSNGVTLVGGNLIVPANVTSFTVTYATLDDALNEATETTALNVGGVIGVGSITDNDATPSISINDVTVNEAAGTATFTVTLSAASGQTVTVGYNTSNGTATAGSDYTSAAGTLTFTPGTTTQTITVPITNDTIYEGAVGETFNVNLLTPTNATIADNLGVGTITDNDTAPTIASVGAATVAEGGNLVHTVTLSNASSTSSSFAYSLTGTTATAGSDFSTAASFSNGVTLVGGNLIVPANVTSFTVTYATLDDALNEATETTALNVGGVIGVGSITDNDATPSISINDVTVNEAAGTATFTVTLSAASGQTVTVGYNTSNGTATAGSDYTSAAGTLTFTPGTTTQTITVPITNDILTEATETFNVNLLSPTNATISDALGVGTIIDNDAPPVAVGNNNTGLEDASYIVVTLTGTDSDGTVSSFNLSSLPIHGALYLDAALTQLVSTATDITASGNALQLYFKPEADFNTLANGPLSFNFTAKDNTGLVSPTATETITITAVNDGAPVTVADNYSTVLGTPIIISKASLLSNDTLFDHAQITSITALSGTGTLVDNGNGTYTYTPAATGSRTFNYTVTDDDGQNSTSTVTLTTYNTRDDLATVNESALAEGNGGGTRTVTGNLLSNDAGNTSVTSLTGATLSGGVYTVSSAYGTLQVTAATGAYTYTLNNNVDNDTQSGATNTGYLDTFTYTGNSTGNGTPISLRVNIVDDAPTATNATVLVAEANLPAFNIVMMLDVSGSMTTASAGGQVRDVADDGSATIATRLAMAKAGMIALVDEYFSQSSSVTITLATFSSAAQINGTYTSKEAAIAAINGLTGSGGTNYEAALNTIQTAFGTPSQSVSNISYFISDGAPSQGNTTDPVGASGYATFIANNNIKSYAVGIGSGIATTGPLDAINNVDSDGSGTADPAIIVADLNKLETALLSTVPHAFGGNVVTSGGSSNVTFGADGGFIRYIDLMLDSDGNGTADQSVRFTYNAATNQITTNGSFVTGFPVSSDTMTLGVAQGFVSGKLVFDFSTGDYKYFTEGQGVEGTQFDIGFQVMDNDGDTANAVQTVMVVDGKPIAYNDFDTLMPNSKTFEGNVISAVGTDGSTGALITSFTAASSGADLIVDNATVSSITFKGIVYNLTVNSSGSASGGTYTITNGHLTWTSSTEPANQLVFDKDGYYKYTPPAVQTAQAAPDAAVTTLFNTAGNATANGVTLSGVTRTGNVSSPNATLTYSNPNGTANDGVGINGGGSNNNVDNLETLIIRFDSTTHPQGVQNVVVNVSANQSNLGDNGAGTIISLTYSVYDTSGNLLGQFASFAEGSVAIPSIYGNIGYIEVEANSAASALISGVTFNSSNVNATAIGYAPEDISYTLTDSDGDASTATLKLSTTINHYAGGAGADNITGSAANDYITGGDGNDTLNGGAGYDIIIGGAGNDTIDGGADNDQLYGGDGNDTINGGTGNDLIYGGAGNDIVNGGDGNDTIYGGAGNDVINGGLGADTIYGGAGNDTLTGGGVGVDVFKWELTDQGAKGAPAADVITDFNAASVAAGGDVLDLRDLLVGENHDVGAGNLASFLHFEKSGADTIVHISSNGEFAAGFNSAKEVQTITLTGVDLVGSFTNDQQIVQDLLSKQKLVTD